MMVCFLSFLICMQGYLVDLAGSAEEAVQTDIFDIFHFVQAFIEGEEIFFGVDMIFMRHIEEGLFLILICDSVFEDEFLIHNLIMRDRRIRIFEDRIVFKGFKIRSIEFFGIV